jgi:hypothetical protein
MEEVSAGEAAEENGIGSSSVVETETQDIKTLQHDVRAKEKLSSMDDDEGSGGGTTRPPEEMKGSCGSWIVEMEELGFKADTPGDTATACCQQKPSIYRVPEWIQGFTNRSAYRPRLVSFGPFHHGAPDLVPMEEHKLQAVLHLVKRSGKPLAEFTASIEEVVEDLLGAYDKLDVKWRWKSRGGFVKMMVMDGCFLLEFMQSSCDYAPNNPIFCYHGLLTMCSDIRSDMVVMENQLPLLVLQRLVAVRDDRDPVRV